MVDCFESSIIQSYLMGTLEEEQAGLVADHLEHCGACQAIAGALDGVGDVVIDGLRVPVSESPYVNEPEYLQAVERARELFQGKLVGPGQAGSGASSAEAIPGQVGHYRLLEPIGFGGMGVVYRAQHTELGRLVALKIPRPSITGGCQVVERFRRELQSIGQLQHPNVVAALDAGQADGVYYLAMEYIEGCKLSELVRRGDPLRIADACELIRQAATGLEFVHSRSLVHRDVKPSNLMLDQSGCVKILDFGLALRAQPICQEELTSAGQMLGTHPYMAPEQCRNSHDVDMRADVYSLGCTFYRLLTGRPPSCAPIHPIEPVGGTGADACPIAATLPQWRPDLPPALLPIVQRMLAPDRENRFGSFQQLAQTLTPFCEGCDLTTLVRQFTDSTTLFENAASETRSIRKKSSLPNVDRLGSGVGPVNRVADRWRLAAWGALLVLLSIGVAAWWTQAWHLIGRSGENLAIRGISSPDASGIAVSDSASRASTGESPLSADADPTWHSQLVTFADGWAVQQGVGGPHPDDGGLAIAADRAGNLYVTGSVFFQGDSGSNPGKADAFVAKFTAQGQLEWRHRLGNAEGDDRGYAVAVDAVGDVYVAGQFQGEVDFDPGEGSEYRRTAGGSVDAFLLKLTTDGHFDWVATYGQTDGHWKIASALTVDDAGDVIVAGSFGGEINPGSGSEPLVARSVDQPDVFVIRLDSSGQWIWARSFGGKGFDSVTQVLTDPQGNVYLTGGFQSTVVFDPLNPDNQQARRTAGDGGADAFVLQLRPDGSFGWVRSIGGSGYHKGTALTLAPDGLYFSALFQSEVHFDGPDDQPPITSHGWFDALVGKMDRDSGQLIWMRQASGPGNNRPRGLAVADDGSLCVVGVFSETIEFDPQHSGPTLRSAGGPDGFLWHLDASGTTRSAARLGGPGRDAICAITRSPDGCLVITGHFEQTADFRIGLAPVTLSAAPDRGQEIFVIKLSEQLHDR